MLAIIVINLCTDQNLIGMLETSGYRSIDGVYLTLGSINNRCCGEAAKTPIIRAFTLYSDILASVFQKKASWMVHRRVGRPSSTGKIFQSLLSFDFRKISAFCNVYHKMVYAWSVSRILQTVWRNRIHDD